MYEKILKSSLRDPPDHFILHVGTIDLRSEESPETIAKDLRACNFIKKGFSTGAFLWILLNC